MAHTIEHFPASAGRPPKYNWDLWTNGENWVLTQGEDFDSTVHSFRTLVHRTRKVRGLKARTHITEAVIEHVLGRSTLIAPATITVKFWKEETDAV